MTTCEAAANEFRTARINMKHPQSGSCMTGAFVMHSQMALTVRAYLRHVSED